VLEFRFDDRQPGYGLTMMLALSTLSPTAQGILFLIAVILFAVGAVIAHPSYPLTLISAGLAFFAVVFAWNAFALS
jgi:hypothetical protein